VEKATTAAMTKEEILHEIEELRMRYYEKEAIRPGKMREALGNEALSVEKAKARMEGDGGGVATSMKEADHLQHQNPRATKQHKIFKSVTEQKFWQ
jgi:hypothetical protein